MQDKLNFCYYDQANQTEKTVVCRPITAQDIPLLFALDQLAYENLDNKNNYVPLNQAEMDYMQAIAAKFFGIFDGDKLIAYYGLWPHDHTHNHEPKLQAMLEATGMDNLAKDLPFVPEAEWPQNIEFHRALFHPDYQDFGINQHFLPIILEQIKSWGYRHLTATISPFNCPSFISAIKSGFTVGGLETKYENFVRYIMYRQLQQPVVYTNQEVLCYHQDLGKQLELLSQGYRGKGIFKDPDQIDPQTQKPKIFVIYDTLQK